MTGLEFKYCSVKYGKTGCTRLRDVVNTFPQNTGISKLISPVAENVEVEGNY